MAKQKLTTFSMHSTSAKIALPFMVIVLTWISINLFSWMFDVTNAASFVSRRADLISLVAIIFVPPVTIVLHELVHAFFCLIFGGKPKFGAGMIYKIVPYFTTSSPNLKLNLWQMTIVGLSPLIVLSLAAIGFAFIFPQMMMIWMLALGTNIVGACADVWFTFNILWTSRRYEHPVVVDRGDSLDLQESSSSNIKRNR